MGKKEETGSEPRPGARDWSCAFRVVLWLRLEAVKPSPSKACGSQCVRPAGARCGPGNAALCRTSHRGRWECTVPASSHLGREGWTRSVGNLGGLEGLGGNEEKNKRHTLKPACVLSVVLEKGEGWRLCALSEDAASSRACPLRHLPLSTGGS